MESGTRAEAAHAEHTARASEAREGAQAERAPEMHQVQHAHSAPEPIDCADRKLILDSILFSEETVIKKTDFMNRVGSLQPAHPLLSLNPIIRLLYFTAQRDSEMHDVLTPEDPAEPR